MKISVIIPTYNSPRALKYCLLGFLTQTNDDFEIVIVDDGSTGDTRLMLEDPRFQALRMRYLWQVDDGFRKTLLLNRGIATAEGDYLIFCDGDCIPRSDFVANHVRLARPKQYVSGVRLEIPMEVHNKFTDDLVSSQTLFDVESLQSRDAKLGRYWHRLSKSRLVIGMGNLLTKRLFVFHGSNASAWKKDLLKINGFDEQFLWGSEDRDVGARLKNIGVRSRFAKYSLVQLHLEHSRSWVDPTAARSNRKIFKARLWGFDRTTRVEPGVSNALERHDDMQVETISKGPDRSNAAA